MGIVLQRLRAGPYREVDPAAYPAAFVHAVDWPEVEDLGKKFRWRLVPDVPVRLFDPWSREQYELDPDSDPDDIVLNLARYDMIAEGLEEGFVFPPILVAANGFVLDGYHRLAAMHERDPTATTDVLWAYSKTADTNPRIPLSTPLAFSTQGSRDGSLYITLYDPTQLGPYREHVPLGEYLEPAILGWMHLWPEYRGFRKVAFSSARHGHGPTLYELAFEIGRREGWEVMPGEEISDAAMEVWRQFAERSDVRMEELPPDLRLYDVEHLDSGATMAVPLRGFSAAERRGQSFVRGLERKSGLSRDTILHAVYEAGHRLIGRIQAERRNPTNLAAVKARMLAY